jgi:dTDP-glucose 4,6-dehydratase
MEYLVKTCVITGGAGFIGSCLARKLIEKTDFRVVIVDKLTYAGNLESLASISDDSRFHFIESDICDQEKMTNIFTKYTPQTVFHLAAESHVDRSIEAPMEFVRTNVLGTVSLLQAALGYWQASNTKQKEHFKFHHISTDEVYGQLGATGAFVETTPYDPRSPYSASKAASDHFVSAYYHTYGLPVVVTNCSNNYGPFHFPEKLIPLVILNALEGRKIPVYGDGRQVRDWLYVEDHVAALMLVAERGRTGQTYNIGGDSELENIQVVKKICAILDRLKPSSEIGRREDLITYVQDRPGHDRRYAIDFTKMKSELGWSPSMSFDEGLERTVSWYLNNQTWWQRVRSGVYRGERLGLKPRMETL